MKNPRARNSLWAGYLCLAGFMIFTFIAGSPAFAQGPLPGGTLNPTTIPKYVIPLVIPPVMPASTSGLTPAANYDIAVRQFQQQILPGGIWGSGPWTVPNPAYDPILNPTAPTTIQVTGMPASTVWSYGRYEDPAPTGGIAPAQNTTFNYPAFTIETSAGQPVNVRWINDLIDPATGNYRPHLFPIDQTLHWANPANANCIAGYPNRTDCETAIAAPYTGPVPMIPHVHGSHVQPNSDGYPEAWWLPGAPGTHGIPLGYAEHGSLYTQANSANAVPGSAYFSYQNDNADTTLWYHDHTLGMTRVNVVAGPAGFWLVRGGAYGAANVIDSATAATAVLPGPAPTVGGGDPNFDLPVGTRAAIREIPIVIQDRAFNTDGTLFYPPDRNFFDGFKGPYVGGAGTPVGPSDVSGIWNPEVFFNTIVVNGTTWPKFDVAPALYRFRLLDGCTARTLNLAMFVVTGPGADTVYGTPDDVVSATEVPFYQIGAEQGFLPNVVMISTGFATVLPGNGAIPAPAAGSDPARALLIAPAERADVIVDFRALAGQRIRMINTAPDAPFQGVYANPANPLAPPPADPSTTGQVMDFIVSAAGTALPADANTTPPENLKMPAQAALPAATLTRQLSLNELESEQVCVSVDAVSGAITGTLFSTFPGDPTFVGRCTAAAGFPAGPRQARLGVVASDGVGNLLAVSKRWGDPVTEMPLLNSTETWEIFNTTADAHPIHIHLVQFQVVDRQPLDPTALATTGNLVTTGLPTPPEPNELGFKDTVVSLPGQVTRVKMTFDIAGLYVWHCHIVDHEDNEMMRPFVVSTDLLYANYPGFGLHKWNGASWALINGAVPAKMAAAGSTVYAGFTGYGLYKWDGVASWAQINGAVPADMLISGSTLYATFTGYGLYTWDGTSWTQINGAVPANMVVSGSTLYATFTGYGLYKWDGTTWSKLSDAAPTGMLAADNYLFAQFTGMGLWQWDGRVWSQLAPSLPAKIAVADPFEGTQGPALYATFTGYGFWKWNGSNWTQVNAGDATDIVAAGSTVYASFAGYGLNKWDGFAWTQINEAVPESMAAANSIVYANFTGYGLYKWDGSSWTQINQTIPSTMATGF